MLNRSHRILRVASCTLLMTSINSCKSTEHSAAQTKGATLQNPPSKTNDLKSGEFTAKNNKYDFTGTGEMNITFDGSHAKRDIYPDFYEFRRPRKAHLSDKAEYNPAKYDRYSRRTGEYFLKLTQWNCNDFFEFAGSPLKAKSGDICNVKLEYDHSGSGSMDWKKLYFIYENAGFYKEIQLTFGDSTITLTDKSIIKFTRTDNGGSSELKLVKSNKPLTFTSDAIDVTGFWGNVENCANVLEFFAAGKYPEFADKKVQCSTILTTDGNVSIKQLPDSN